MSGAALSSTAAESDGIGKAGIGLGTPDGIGPDREFPQIDRRAGLSLRDFRHDYLFPQRPVMITDAMAGWPAREKWTFEFLRAMCGKDRVRIYRYDQEKEFQRDAAEEVSLASYIDAIKAKDWREYPYYLRDNWRLLFDHPELTVDYEEPKYFFDWYRVFPRALRMPYPRLFLGPKGATTPLHSDVWDTHAWLSQIVGRKRWILFSPDQKDLHYGNRVRVDAPDLTKYPRYRDARPVETTLGPGDTIFVPSRWAHWVVSLDPTISLTGNYMAYGCFARASGYAIKDFMVTKIGGRITRRR